ncbi:hypothetical protein N7461_001712 [Penicillium sp. DV-2018c]|nr:hypothetical protein N7461_001712 [Penicillium sp. DV-2018c]
MPRAGTRSSGPPGSFDPEDLEHPVEAGPSGQATSEPASTKSNHKDKGKAPVVNEPTDDVNLRIQALAAANDELRARLDSYDRRSMDTLFRSVEDDRGAHHSVFPPAVHFAPAPALPRGVADHPRQEATSRSVSPSEVGHAPNLPAEKPLDEKTQPSLLPWPLSVKTQPSPALWTTTLCPLKKTNGLHYSSQEGTRT